MALRIGNRNLQSNGAVESRPWDNLYEVRGIAPNFENNYTSYNVASNITNDQGQFIKVASRPEYMNMDYDLNNMNRGNSLLKETTDYIQHNELRKYFSVVNPLPMNIQPISNYDQHSFSLNEKIALTPKDDPRMPNNYNVRLSYDNDQADYEVKVYTTIRDGNSNAIATWALTANNIPLNVRRRDELNKEMIMYYPTDMRNHISQRLGRYDAASGIYIVETFRLFNVPSETEVTNAIMRRLIGRNIILKDNETLRDYVYTMYNNMLQANVPNNPYRYGFCFNIVTFVSQEEFFKADKIYVRGCNLLLGLGILDDDVVHPSSMEFDKRRNVYETQGVGVVSVDMVHNEGHKDETYFIKLFDQIIPIKPNIGTMRENGVTITYSTKDGPLAIKKFPLTQLKQHSIYRTELEAQADGWVKEELETQEQLLRKKEAENNSLRLDLDARRIEHDKLVLEHNNLKLEHSKVLEENRFLIEQKKLDLEKLKLNVQAVTILFKAYTDVYNKYKDDDSSYLATEAMGATIESATKGVDLLNKTATMINNGKKIFSGYRF